MKKKFKFENLHKVNFVADRINDELNLTCSGTEKGSEKVIVKTCQPMPLSKNRSYVDVFDAQIKQQLKFQKIDISILDIDFKNENCKTEIFYVDVNGEKKNTSVPLKF